MSRSDPIEQAHDCNECPLASRRDFLRDGLVAIAGVIASLGLARTASALPVSMTSALRRLGTRRAYAIPAADGAQIDKDNGVILVRWQGAVYAFNLSCPHQNTALRWNDSANRFQCPKHHSQYQPDGEFIEGRATRGMDRLGITRSGTNVMVDLDSMYQQDEDPNGWAAQVVKL